MDRPFAGMRVVDLTQALSGPVCTHHLAMLGADVVKVERPAHGDMMRRTGFDDDLRAAGMGTTFLAVNGGKKSVLLDLTRPEGREVLLRLVDGADVLVENNRAGVLDRLGLGGAEMLARNPRLVYCALTGFGQDGPWKDRAAYDHIVQAVSGVMNYTGGDGPALSGIPIVDVFSGLMAAFAVASALVARARTGKGRIVDVSMLETLVYLLGYYAVGALATGENPPPLGNAGIRGRPGSGTFETADGHLVLTVFMPPHRAALCRAIDRDDLLAEMSAELVEFDLDTAARLRAELQKTLRTKPAAEWEEILVGAGLGAAKVRAMDEALAHPQLLFRRYLEHFDAIPGTGGRAMDLPGLAFTLDGDRPRSDGPPPCLGADTEAVLGGLGYGAAEIAALRDAGVIGGADAAGRDQDRR